MKSPGMGCTVGIAGTVAAIVALAVAVLLQKHIAVCLQHLSMGRPCPWLVSPEMVAVVEQA